MTWGPCVKCLVYKGLLSLFYQYRRDINQYRPELSFQYIYAFSFFSFFPPIDGSNFQHLLFPYWCHDKRVSPNIDSFNIGHNSHSPTLSFFPFAQYLLIPSVFPTFLLNTTMAKPPSNQLLSTLLLTFLALTFPKRTISDVPCQYPCYPPPMGTTVTPTTPSTTSPSGVSGYQPPSGGVYPTPSGYNPYNNPPPNYGGYYGGQPPPDPILPYFPFYYKKPIHSSPDDQSYSSSTRPTLIGRSAQYLMVLLFFCFFFINYTLDLWSFWLVHQCILKLICKEIRVSVCWAMCGSLWQI